MSAPEPAVALRRLHPASLLINLLLDAKKFVLPGLVVLAFARGNRWELWLMALFVPAAIFEVVRCLTIRFGLKDGHLVVRRGLLFRAERHIPIDRIQNVDLVQTVLHRLWRVADVRIETASGQEPEAVLRVLALRDVEILRSQIFSGKNGAARTQTAGEGADLVQEHELVRLSFGELVKLGLVSNRGIALVVAAIGLAHEFDLWSKLVDRFANETSQFESMNSSQQIGWGLLAAAVVVVVVFGLSMAWGVVLLWGFRLSRRGQDLRSTCGLFTRWSATIPRRRVQFLSIQESVLHRLFHRVSLRVETAGGGESDDSPRSRKWFAPLLPTERTAELVAEVMPGVRLPVDRWRGLSREGVRRLRRARLLLAMLSTLALTLLAGPYAAWSAALFVPLALWATARESRFRAHQLTNDALWYRSGAFDRRTSVIPLTRLQVVSVLESPFDRRAGMASLRIDSAGAGLADHKIHVRYLVRDQALKLQELLILEAARRPLEW